MFLLKNLKKFASIPSSSSLGVGSGDVELDLELDLDLCVGTVGTVEPSRSPFPLVAPVLAGLSVDVDIIKQELQY